MLSLLAGGIHGVATPSHFSDWWGYGLFFMAAAAAQVVYGLLLLTRGIVPGPGRSWDDVRPSVYALGLAGNLAIVAMWILSRTVGIPVGPCAGLVEDVGALDLASKVLEVALLGVLATLGLLWRKAHLAGRRPH